MIATRFRTVGWVAGVATAALGCYLVSQSVAAERAGLARIDVRIAATQADIHRLTTEVGTRGRMSQLDRWNSEVLALQAPGARQFAASEVQLASLNGPRPLPIDPAVAATKGSVEQAAYTPPPAPAAAAPAALPPRPAAEPMLRPATYVRVKPDRIAGEGTEPLVKASLDRKATLAPAPDQPIVRVAFAKPARLALAADIAAEPPRAPIKARRAPLDLLPDDIDSLVAAERRAGKTKR